MKEKNDNTWDSQLKDTKIIWILVKNKKEVDDYQTTMNSSYYLLPFNGCVHSVTIGDKIIDIFAKPHQKLHDSHCRQNLR